eukprot:TRINITY_DN14745_c0_g1_i1.p2 TRINITY_DN14745_c0_g1~~TRINITY_DN14745_c0_g1_i1.p2  ORF type:complete len:204 (-),score=53.30 TRINITY_DN14745_c0_g1_i1:499-1110(-)
MAMLRSASRLAASQAFVQQECNVLEAARQRLQHRFQQRWPADADATPAATANFTMKISPEELTDNSGNHLEAARSRLQARFAARWGPSASINTAAQSPALDMLAAPVETVDHLEAARLRLRQRFEARWPMASQTPLEMASEAQVAAAKASPQTGGVVAKQDVLDEQHPSTDADKRWTGLRELVKRISDGVPSAASRSPSLVHA